MANSSDPVLVAFTREIIRVLADHSVGQSDALNTTATFYTTQINQPGGPLDIMDDGDLILDGVLHRPTLSKADMEELVAVYVAQKAVYTPAALIVLTKAFSTARNPLS